MTKRMVGRLLREARRRAGLTQIGLAAAVGASQPVIARVESGKVSPRAEMLLGWFRATGSEIALVPRLGADVDRTELKHFLRMNVVDRVRHAIAAGQRPRGRRTDPIRMLRRLRRFGVQVVVIGELAEAAHGAPISVRDVQIVPKRTRDNHDRIALALAHPDLGVTTDAAAIEAMEDATLHTAAGPLELVSRPPATDGFADLDANASPARVANGLTVRVASLDDLIRIRREAAAQEDRTLEQLGALRDELDGW